MNDELRNDKANLLKFEEEKKQREKEGVLLIENEKDLKKKQDDLENEVNEKGKETEVQIIPPPVQDNVESIA